MVGIGKLIAATVLVTASCAVGQVIPTTNAAEVRPASGPSARAVVEQATREALEALRDRSTPIAKRLDRVREIAAAHLDFAALARLAMGEHWRELSPAQREQLVREFRQHLLTVYGQMIEAYKDEDAVVSEDHAESRGDWTVRQQLLGHPRPNGARPGIGVVSYRMRQRDGEWKAIDMSVEGLSVAALFRAQFQAVIASGGNERLIQLLHEKNAEPEAAPGAGK
jgi:phospholipid transport system substrate-binding protein